MALTFRDDEAPRMTRAVQWLIAINVAIHFVQLTVVGDANMLPALGFQAHRFASSWWTALTYMFVHAGFWHLVLNMVTLAMFGPRVEHRWAPAMFVRFYLWCGLGGLLFHLLFAQGTLVVGASAAVYGVMVAYATYWPDDEVLIFGVIPMKARWFVLLLVAVSLFSGMSTGSGSGVAYLAHLGGVAAAWVALRWPSSGVGLERVRQHVSATPDLPDETPRAIPRQMPRPREQRSAGVDDIVARSNAALRRREAPAPEPARRASTIDLPPRMDDLDAVLDKISRTGMESLTLEERRVLEARSRELRKGDAGEQ